jgi:hypothetical protein
VSDIFNEVDEELRRERLKKLWERYGVLIIALAVLFVAAVGGWRAYQWYEAKKAAEAGAAFDAAALLSEQHQHKEAAAAFAKIAEGASAYRVLAKLREAAVLADHDAKAAVAIYDAVASDRSLDQVQRDLAALRAAYILVDTAAYDELKNRIEPLTAADRAFRHSARALLALSAWRANNAAETRRWADMVLADPNTPTNTRNQIEILMALAASSGKG